MIVEWSMDFVEQNSIPEPNTGCWLWLGAVDDDGYARQRSRGRNVIGHRRTLELKLGRPLTSNEVARHLCDNPSCVNPDHLIEGSVNDNNQDCVRRGRRPFGSAVANSKLTDAEFLSVIKMLEAGRLQRDIASMFDVTASTISHIKNGRSWVKVRREDEEAQPHTLLTEQGSKFLDAAE